MYEVPGRPSLFFLSRFVCTPLCHRTEEGIAKMLLTEQNPPPHFSLTPFIVLSSAFFFLFLNFYMPFAQVWIFHKHLSFRIIFLKD